MDIVTRVQRQLQKYDIPAEVWQEGNQIVVSIEWGDWKHDHLRCDYVMRLIKYESVREEETDTDGSDCYSSRHYYEPIKK